jgi:fatty acid desaturase
MTAATPFPNHLLDDTTRRRLRVRTNVPAIGRLTVHLAALLATGVWVVVSAQTPWLAPSLVLHGIVLVFLFAPLHETIHDTAFRTKVLNRWLATILGTLLLLPAGYFRHFHAAHHRLTNVPGDPELAEDKRTRTIDYIIHILGWPLWRDRITTLCRNALGRVDESFVPGHRRRAVAIEARVTLAFYAGVGAMSWTQGWGEIVLGLWIVPMILGQPFLRVFLLAEHGGRPEVPDMLRNSRTTHSNALVRLLAWNMTYHSEHHAFPWVPFHALPDLHHEIAPHLIDPAPGYAATLMTLLRATRR